MYLHSNAPFCRYLFDLNHQNLQQSRSFGSTFKFPEGEGRPATDGAAAGSGTNTGFGEDAADDDLYA